MTFHDGWEHVQKTPTSKEKLQRPEAGARKNTGSSHTSSTIRLDLVQVEDVQAERHAKKYKAEDIKNYDTGKDQLKTVSTIW